MYLIKLSAVYILHYYNRYRFDHVFDSHCSFVQRGRFCNALKQQGKYSFSIRYKAHLDISLLKCDIPPSLAKAEDIMTMESLKSAQK